MLLLQQLCCYCYSDIEFRYNCYYQRVIDKLCCYCYSDIEFCYNCYYERVIICRVQGDAVTLPLLLLTSFATITTANASADATVARVAFLTAVIVHMLSLIHI